MDRETFENLRTGDIIRHKRSKGEAYVVAANYGTYVIISRIKAAYMPFEWDLVMKAEYKGAE